jgi:hypothetical protein
MSPHFVRFGWSGFVVILRVSATYCDTKLAIVLKCMQWSEGDNNLLVIVVLRLPPL